MTVYQSDVVMGMDLGDRWAQVCTIDTSSGEILEDRVRMTPRAIRRHFEGVCARLIALEVGTHSRWVSQTLEDLGHRTVVANARRLHLISKSDTKNDRADAELLARVAAVDPQLLCPIHHRSDAAQADLALLRTRDKLVHQRTALVLQVRGVAKSFGLRLRRASAERFAQRAREALSEELQPSLTPLLDTIESLTGAIRSLDKQVEQICRDRYPQAQRLRQIPGVGPLTALAFVLVLEDPTRFAHSRAVGSYLGLRPRQHESGANRKQLRITKAGDPYLRCLLVQCAHYILGPFGPETDLRRWGLSLADRGGTYTKGRAVVAVARKLATVMHSMWVHETDYEPLRSKPRAAA